MNTQSVYCTQIFVCLIFVVRLPHENILTMDISQSIVLVLNSNLFVCRPPSKSLSASKVQVHESDFLIFALTLSYPVRERDGHRGRDHHDTRERDRYDRDYDRRKNKERGRHRDSDEYGSMLDFFIFPVYIIVSLRMFLLYYTCLTCKTYFGVHRITFLPSNLNHVS